MQPFVQTAATTSSFSTQRGSVPEMSTPSSWRWLMTKYDIWPRWRLLHHTGFFLTLSLFFIPLSSALPYCCFWKEERQQEGSSLLHMSSWRTLVMSLRAKGKTDKHGDSWLGCGGKKDGLPPQNQSRRGSLYLWTDLKLVFRTSSTWWTEDCFYLHRDGLVHDRTKPSEQWDLCSLTPPNPTVGCASKDRKISQEVIRTRTRVAISVCASVRVLYQATLLGVGKEGHVSITIRFPSIHWKDTTHPTDFELLNANVQDSNGKKPK